MTEKEFRRQLSELLRNPPKSTYASSLGGTYEDTDYYKFETELLALFEEAGWKSPEMLKAEGYYQAVPFEPNGRTGSYA